MYFIICITFSLLFWLYFLENVAHNNCATQKFEVKRSLSYVCMVNGKGNGNNHSPQIDVDSVKENINILENFSFIYLIEFSTKN